MPLNGALQIGRSALTASQLAIQVAGNNVANATTLGYSRQDISMRPITDSRSSGGFIGRGVEVQSIRRQVDSALQQRLLGGTSAQGAANTDLQQLAEMESLLSDLDGQGLTSQLGRFYNSWSELANSPNLGGNRSLVVQQGRTLAAYMRDTRGQLEQHRSQIETQLQSRAQRVNGLLGEIASANAQIVIAEGGSSQANGLRDRRDMLIGELAQHMDVTTVQQSTGAVDVLVGSSPVVMGGTSRGIEYRAETTPAGTNVAIVTRDNAEQLNIRGGTIGSLLAQRTTLVNDTINRLDDIASQLIFQVNRVHSQGLGGRAYTNLSGTLNLGAGDASLAMNDPTNASFSALRNSPQSGSFLVRVRNDATGEVRTATINVDLDGLTSTLGLGTADDTSVGSLAAQLGGVANLTASVTGDGHLSVSASSGYTLSFGDDTSGVLAVLGVNAYFTGTDASNIAVRTGLSATPDLLASGRYVTRTAVGAIADTAGQEADFNENGAAMLIAGLRTAKLSEFGNASISDVWGQTVQAVAVKTAAARTAADSAAVVKENLDAQRSAVAGVSLDEEAINLINYQRQYQASARYISVVDELTQTLISLIG